MKEVRISDINSSLYSVFNNPKYEDVILTSGRSGTKSSFQAIEAVYEIVSGKGSVCDDEKEPQQVACNTVFPE